MHFFIRGLIARHPFAALEAGWFRTSSRSHLNALRASGIEPGTYKPEEDR